MGQKGQRSDTHTLTHEAQTLTRDVVTAPFRLRTYRLIRKILIGFILVSIANVLFSYFFYTPKMYRIIRENRDLVIKYRILQDRIRTAQRHVDEIRHRDNYVYRSLFSTDTMSIEGVWQPYPDTKYAALLDDDYAPLTVGTWRQLDALARTLYLESVSFDELQAFSQDKEKMSAAVPAISSKWFTTGLNIPICSSSRKRICSCAVCTITRRLNSRRFSAAGTRARWKVI